MQMIRLLFIYIVLSLVSSAQANNKIGVVLMHGKQGGGQRDTSLDSLHKKLYEAGMLVIKPEMPWSFNRFIDGHWDLV